MAQSCRDPSAKRGDLLRLPLLPRNPRRESAHRPGHCLSDTDSYFDAAQFGCDWLDRTKLFGFPRSCAGGDFYVKLILSIIHPEAALHDGGVIIRNGRIAAAACIVPVSQRETLDRSLGLRHRAGLGITEESDAVAVVVSEEAGSISICHRRRIERNVTPVTFRQRIAEILLHSKYEESDSEKLASDVDLASPGDDALVSDQKERSDDAIAV